VPTNVDHIISKGNIKVNNHIHIKPDLSEFYIESLKLCIQLFENNNVKYILQNV